MFGVPRSITIRNDAGAMLRTLVRTHQTERDTPKLKVSKGAARQPVVADCNWSSVSCPVVSSKISACGPTRCA
ncbi:Uncharacterised protein [Mycobacteroides abscessus subsp. abscessus]|nr:Uncharacterised protein [Mycobacteroides abscessus subsp. abscessus]